MRSSDWSSDVCSSDLGAAVLSVASRAPLDGLNVLGHAKDTIYPSVFISHSVNNDWVNESKDNFDLAVRNTTATLRGLHWGFANKNKMLKWLEEVAKVPRKVVTDYYAVAFESERPLFRSEEHTSELQSLMRQSYAVFC